MPAKLLHRRVLERLEQRWRHAVVYPMLRRVFHNKRIDAPVDLAKVRSVLFLRHDRIGDMVVSTPIFRKLKRDYPGLRIAVLARPLNAGILAADRYVDRVYVLPNNWGGIVRMILEARRERFDVVVNFIFNRTSTSGILANLIAPLGIKIGQGEEKYRFYFNRLLTLPRSVMHMTDILAYMFEEAFGKPLEEQERDLEIGITPDSLERCRAFAVRHGLRTRGQNGGAGRSYAIVNISVNDPNRILSLEQVRFFAVETARRGVMPVVSWAPGDEQRRSAVEQVLADCEHVCFPETGKVSLLDLAAVIGGAVWAVSPDTSIVHFASAMKTPVFALFSTEELRTEWHPYRVPNRTIVSEGRKPVGMIPIDVIAREYQQFLAEAVDSKE